MKKILIVVLVFAGGFFLASNVLCQESMNAMKDTPKMDSAMEDMMKEDTSNTMDSSSDNMMMRDDNEETGDSMNADKMEGEDMSAGTGDDLSTGADEDIVAEAEATIKGTAPDSKLNGFADLIETKEGVYVDAELYSAPAGKHGLHIHENGSCEDSGNAAGGHFNPDNVQHGNFPEDGAQKAHVGDMGNVEVDENGEAYFSVFLPGVSLSSGKHNVMGKAIVLHEKVDDMGQPTGNAGGRIGCGVIQAVKY